MLSFFKNGLFEFLNKLKRIYLNHYKMEEYTVEFISSESKYFLVFEHKNLGSFSEIEIDGTSEDYKKWKKMYKKFKKSIKSELIDKIKKYEDITKFIGKKDKLEVINLQKDETSEFTIYFNEDYGLLEILSKSQGYSLALNIKINESLVGEVKKLVNSLKLYKGKW